MVPNLSVCADCYIAAANGHDDDTPKEVRDRFGAAHWSKGELLAECGAPFGADCQQHDGHGYPYCGGDGFRKTPCEYCGDTLAGDRHHAILSRDIPRN
jgi:hypothetical protein